MEEKKLTDEEVIKGLECCSKGCCDKSCFGSEMSGITECTNILTKNALDLIHSLQGKVAEYERKLADGEICSMDYHNEQMGVLNCEIEEYKAQIERLKNERIDLIGRNAGLCSSNNRLKERISKYKMQLNEQGVMLKLIKELRVPPYDKFSIWDKYGISQECYIKRNNITKDPYFIAVCFNRYERFANSEQGLQDAVAWLEEQRVKTLLLLGYKELQNG